ncbi:MAG: ABC transporter ATP-binding protein [Burkholderiaceae bacterium]|nr:ABC transporter ATP-binding protein [Burkholderiaceae bacterium]
MSSETRAARERSASGDLAIEVIGLGKLYPVYDRPVDRLLQMLWRGRRRYYREFHALDDVSFALRRGGTLGIIGRNGAGKSTLLQLICGTLAPSVGTVRVAGRIAALLELGAGFNPEFTGRENVLINAAILGLGPAEIAARLDQIFEFADIGEYVDQPVKTYSSGMYVRLAFAVAIHVSPDILVVDEALSVGDAFFQARCMARIRRMLDEGVTLLFISHDIAAVKALCNEVLWLDRGRVRAHGPTDRVAALYTRDWVEQANRAAVAPGAAVAPNARSSDSGSAGGGAPARAAASGAGGDAVQADSDPSLAPIPQTGHERGGDGRARFVAAGWRTPSGPAQHAVVEWGERLTIEAELRIVSPCERLVLSYHVKDRHQQHLIGGHTGASAQFYGRVWRAGERVRVRFSFAVPLHEGAYTLSLLVASIADLASYSDAVFLDWVEDLSLMHVAARRPFPLSDLVELEHEMVVEMVQSGDDAELAGAR